MSLPEAFAGKTTVLVVGFSQSAREPVAVWGRRLAALYGGSATVQYFEVPVLAAVPRLLRGLVLGKVKDGVPQRAWAHCLPVTEHEAEWKRAAGYRGADSAYLLVVDGGGVVQAHWEGNLAPATEAAVTSEVSRRNR